MCPLSLRRFGAPLAGGEARCPQRAGLTALSAALCCLALTAGVAGADPAPAWDTGLRPGGGEIALDAAAGAPSKLHFSSGEIPLAAGKGGFFAADYNSGPDINVLGPGRVTEAGGALTYAAEGADLAVRAEFIPENGSIRVKGTIENRRHDDRAVIVRYVLPVPAPGAVFQDEPSGGQAVGPETAGLGTAYPLAAMTGPGWGAALAIPPTFPCCFGMLGSSSGLGVEFYLGISPKPRRFPNRAPFEFVIYPALPGWGFRSALAEYCRDYSPYYDTAFPGAGFSLWQENGPIDYALPLFKVECAPRSPAAFPFVTGRAKRFDLIATEDIGATVRSVRDLPELPKDYAGAMAAFAAYKPVWNGLGAREQARKYPQYMYRDVINVIERCAITQADGKYRIQLRDFSWSPKSIAFTTNPNPELFRDRGWASVGSTMVQAAEEYMRSDPTNGTLVDSLGANFPAYLNYRQDHFAYAQYPLTFDRRGRIALHNVTSHYELMAALREVDHKYHKYSGANGIYRYNRGLKNEEQYHGVDNGRFFLGAVLDQATRECSKVLERKDFEFGRAAMGRKLYNVAIHNWTSGADVRRQLNRALPFTTFAQADPHNGQSYLASPNGYFRDEDEIKWFARNARLLSAAGWQPVTAAAVDHPAEVACERYGSGAKSYFAVANYGRVPLDTVLELDLAALGLAGTGDLRPIEIARGLPVVRGAAGKAVCSVRLRLKPDEAQVIGLLLPGDFAVQIGAMARSEGAALAILAVDPRSSAAQSGIEAGDRIVKINGQTTPADPKEAAAAISGEPWSTVALRIRRGTQEWDVNTARTD